MNKSLYLDYLFTTHFQLVAASVQLVAELHPRRIEILPAVVRALHVTCPAVVEGSAAGEQFTESPAFTLAATILVQTTLVPAVIGLVHESEAAEKNNGGICALQFVPS